MRDSNIEETSDAAGRESKHVDIGQTSRTWDTHQAWP